MLTVINTVCVSSGQLVANVVDALFGNTPHGWRYALVDVFFFSLLLLLAISIYHGVNIIL